MGQLPLPPVRDIYFISQPALKRPLLACRCQMLCVTSLTACLTDALNCTLPAWPCRLPDVAGRALRPVLDLHASQSDLLVGCCCERLGCGHSGVGFSILQTALGL